MKPLRVAFCAGAVLAIAAAGARGAGGSERKLVKAKFSAIQDQMGFRWDLSPNGQINDGTNDCFDGGPSLHIGGAQFTSNRPMMTPDTGEYVLTKTKGNLKVTRRVLIDKKRGAARYLEIFENTGTEKQVLQISLNTRLGGSQTYYVTSTGKPFQAQLGRTDSGLMALRKDQRPCVMFLVTGRGARARPTVAISNRNRNISFTYSLTIPPKKTMTLLHFVAQRNAVTPQTVPSVFRTFYRGRPLKARVPKALAGTIMNFGRFSVSGGDEAGPSVVSDLADSLGVELGARASLVMSEDAILSGDVRCEGLSIETVRGRAEIPFGDIAAIAGGAGSGRTGRLYMRTGEILAGRIEARGLELETPRFRIVLRPEQVNLLFMPTSKADSKPPTEADAFVTMRSGEKLAVKGAGIVLDAATPWGTLRVPFEDLRSLARAEGNTPLHSLTLISGSRLSVILVGGDLEFETTRFGKVAVRPAEIALFARILRSKVGLDFLPESIKRKLAETTTPEIARDMKLADALDSLSEKTTVSVELELGSDENNAAALEEVVGIVIEDTTAFAAIETLALKKSFVVSWRDYSVVLSRASDDDDEEPRSPRFLLAGDNLLVGEIDLEELTVTTEAGETAVKTTDIISMERAESASGFETAFSFELVGGDRLTGAIQEAILPIRTGRGQILRVPVEHIASFQRPPPEEEDKEPGVAPEVVPGVVTARPAVGLFGLSASPGH